MQVSNLGLLSSSQMLQSHWSSAWNWIRISTNTMHLVLRLNRIGLYPAQSVLYVCRCSLHVWQFYIFRHIPIHILPTHVQYLQLCTGNTIATEIQYFPCTQVPEQQCGSHDTNLIHCMVHTSAYYSRLPTSTSTQQSYGVDVLEICSKYYPIPLHFRTSKDTIIINKFSILQAQ